MNYETRTFGMDVILAIISQDEPYPPKKDNLVDQMNESFIREMIVRESEAEYLVSIFYNENIQKMYTNKDKVCRVKDISSEE